MFATPQTIFISGGTSGIGLALLKQLHKHGHSFIIVARNKAKLSKLQSQFERVTIYECDLSSRQQIESLVDNISKKHPQLSVLINNAAIQKTPTFIDDDFSFNSIEYETTVNFLAPVWLSYLFLPILMESDKSSAIVNISSGLVYAPKKTSAIYCATKAAIHSISQSLRCQLSDTNIVVHEAIMPLVDTPMTAGRDTKKISADQAASKIISGINAGKAEIHVGIAKLLPVLMRFSPSLVKNILGRC